jgi:hypothetical protein
MTQIDHDRIAEVLLNALAMQEPTIDTQRYAPPSAQERLEVETDAVCLDIAHTPVLFRGELKPCPATQLSSGNYGIYDAPHRYQNMGDTRWNVPVIDMRELRARFLLQLDTLVADLIFHAHNDDRPHRFNTWDGRAIFGTPHWQLREMLLGWYLPDGLNVPKLVQAHILQGYQYADGTIETFQPNLAR